MSDLVQRIRRDKDARSGTLFPSATIPREPMTEVLPAAHLPIAASDAPDDGDHADEQPALPIKVVCAAAGVCATLVVLFACCGWIFLQTNDNAFRQTSALDEKSRDVAAPFASAGDDTYIVVSTGPPAASASSGAPALDTALLVSIPHDRSRVVTIGFPIDLRMHRPMCQGWDPGTSTTTGIVYPDSDHEKLSAIYALGGPKCLVTAIQRMSGIRIDHFLDIDSKGIAAMVDAVGGIHVCSKGALFDADLGSILPGPGPHRIDGETAYKFLTARHVDSDTRAGDGLRRRGQFISALLDAAWSRRVLLNPGRLHGFVTALTRHTSVADVSLRQLLNLDRSLERVDRAAMTYIPLPGKPVADGGVEPLTRQTNALFAAIVGDTALPDATNTPATPSPAAAPTATGTAIDPGAVTVAISAERGHTGSSVANKLAKYGFTIAGVGTAADAGAKTIIRYSPAQAAEAATLATALPDAQLEQRHEPGAAIALVLGSGFSGSVQAPTPAGHTITGTAATAFPPPAPVPPTTDTAPDQFTAADNACR